MAALMGVLHSAVDVAFEESSSEVLMYFGNCSAMLDWIVSARPS